jgi:hypothetical protein
LGVLRNCPAITERQQPAKKECHSELQVATSLTLWSRYKAA